VAHEVEWIGDEERFSELSGEWDGLLPEDATPFDRHCWYECWWRAFAASSELAVCTVRSGDELLGVFPLRREEGRLLPLANDQSSFFRPLAADSEALASLTRAVIEESHQEFELGSLPAQDPCVEALARAAGGQRRHSLLEPQYASPTVDTRGEFDEWRAGSKPRWGAPIERFRRKMGRDHEAEFSIVEPPADLELELRAGFEVEAGGWKGRAGTAILSSPATEAFYSDLGRAFLERGELVLSRIVLDGRVASFDFCILHGRRLYLLKTGFDEEFRKLAPGLVLRLSVIERCFELGLDSHELLGTESEWKQKFATGSREFSLLRTYPRGVPGSARYAYRSILRPRLKSAYGRVRPRMPASTRMEKPKR
jgi:CelD/BcsL family acetyltransferase involved in cellulose biosynthesis